MTNVIWGENHRRQRQPADAVCYQPERRHEITDGTKRNNQVVRSLAFSATERSDQYGKGEPSIRAEVLVAIHWTSGFFAVFPLKPLMSMYRIGGIRFKYFYFLISEWPSANVNPQAPLW